MEGEDTYTTNVPRYSPSPIPSMHLPAINMPRLAAPASIAAPMPKINAPMLIPLGRPRKSATRPAKNEDSAAGMRIADTTSPWIVEDSGPNWAENLLMTVTGPMMPVSILPV